MDPYRVIGVSPSASDDEVKAAYRDLVKKYHPDRYTDSKLKEEASEKLKEINAAYDEIERIRSGKGSSTGGYGGYQSYGGQQYGQRARDPRFQGVYDRIQRNDLTGAESLLDNMADRPAEWHYLKGIVLFRKGWHDGARQHFANAMNMDPSNAEYRRAYQSVNNYGGGFGSFYGGDGNNDSCGTGGCGTCDVCLGLCVLDMCCGGSRCC